MRALRHYFLPSVRRRRRAASWFMRGEVRVKTVLSGLAVMLAVMCCAAQATADTLAEYRIKAGFLFNFIAFTEWPAEVGRNLNLCVYGSDPFGAELDKLQGRVVGQRTLVTTRVSSVDELGDCQIVFITRPMIDNVFRVLDTVSGNPVLTVADSPGAMRQGVALNMGTKQGKVTFEASLAAARGNGLNLSSKLLRLATEVRQ